MKTLFSIGFMTYGAEGFLLRSLDGYGTVGTGLGAGTGAGTVQVRVRYMGTVGTVHGYGTWVQFSYPCTVPTVPVPCTQIAAEIRTMYPNSGRNSSRSATISAAIWVHGTGTVGTVHGYENRTHVPYRPYPYRTRTVPVPYPYLYRTRTRTQTRTNRPVPIIWHTVPSKMANRALLSKLAKANYVFWIFVSTRFHHHMQVPWHALIRIFFSCACSFLSLSPAHFVIVWFL